MLNEFSVSTNWWSLLIWGGGHTLETDPTKKGWRCGLIRKGGENILVGRRGIPGCFSVARMGNNRLDVALYEETPEEVMAGFKTKTVWPEFITLDEIPGWGLKAVEEVAKMQERLKECS